MNLKRSGAVASARGPAETFTGSVRIDPLFHPPEPSRTLGASLAIVEVLDGKAVDWMEKVDDTAYEAAARQALGETR